MLAGQFRSVCGSKEGKGRRGKMGGGRTGEGSGGTVEGRGGQASGKVSGRTEGTVKLLNSRVTRANKLRYLIPSEITKVLF